MAKILSIEDDADMQQIFGKILFQEGYEVHYAWNGREGYEKILKLNPDLLLLDLLLPLMNGLELLKKLKDNKATQDIPAVILTSFGDDASMLKQAVEQMGAAAYLRKPVQINELLRVVKHTLFQFPRSSGGPPPAAQASLRKGGLRADTAFSTVWITDRLAATLPYKEFALLRCLMERSGPAKKAELLQGLGYGPHQGAALKQAVHRLREAFGPAESRRIKTTPEGYELIG